MSGVTLGILAGGESRRMGQPKASLRIGTTPILEFLLRRLDWTGPKLLVTAPGREHPPGCELFDREAVDPIAGEGPLRGVLSALENSVTVQLIITTVDMPLIERVHLDFLLARRENLGAMTRRIVDGSVRIEPFPLAIHKNAIELVRRELVAGRRSVSALSHLPGFVAIDAPSDWSGDVWTNLNTPDDLDEFLRRLA